MLARKRMLETAKASVAICAVVAAATLLRMMLFAPEQFQMFIGLFR